ncbi:MAG: HPr family phosphocarrier protein [Eubacteriaceae bacterium]|jgi:phosphocarrier protein HPr
MLTKRITIKNAGGLHALKAAQLKVLAQNFESDSFLRKGTESASCRHLTSLLALGVKQGETITVYCDGTDQTKALEAISGFLTQAR